MIPVVRAMRPARAFRRPRRGGDAARGFTLIEILLALLLIGLLMAALLLNFTGLIDARSLDEGSMKFEGMLRLARADAANQGKRIRLTLNADDGTYRVEWEGDPLGKPGEYEEYKSASWTAYLPTDMVRIVRIGPPVTGDASGEPPPSSQSITFEPDGSCESMQIELAPARNDDGRRAIIDVEGVTGSIHRTILTPSEAQGAS